MAGAPMAEYSPKVVNAMMHLKPGIHHDVPEAVYHADPCEVPSLNNSTLKRLLGDSPRHAHAFHPRLGGRRQEEREEFDFGKAVHALVLEQRVDSIVIVEAENFRTKAAQQERDAAYAEGKVPLLSRMWAGVQRTAEAIRAQLDARDDAEHWRMHDARVEQTLVWQEAGGVWCRARLDVVKPSVLWDLKTCESANPEAFARSVFRYGYHLQESFYRRGWRALGGEDLPFFFVAIEKGYPHAVAVYDVSPEAKAIADRQVQLGIDRWRWCLEHDEWPGYPPHVATVEAPSWLVAREIEREVMEAP